MEKDIKEIFDYFDQDNDGVISLEDIDSICQVVGVNFNRREIENLFYHINPALLESIDYKSYKQLMSKKVFKEMTQDDLKNAFKVFDKNNTGRINTAEFHQIMSQVALENEILSKKEVDGFIKMADPRNEGFFDYNQFMRTLH